jgi:hypothetical protein
MALREYKRIYMIGNEGTRKLVLLTKLFMYQNKGQPSKNKNCCFFGKLIKIISYIPLVYEIKRISYLN